MRAPSLCACRNRYNPELTAQWTREIADEIKNKLKTELELPRYKFVVQVEFYYFIFSSRTAASPSQPLHTPVPSVPQVVVGEQRGQGVRMGHRCFWDADTDNYAEEAYRNVRRDALSLALWDEHRGRA